VCDDIAPLTMCDDTALLTMSDSFLAASEDIRSSSVLATPSVAEPPQLTECAAPAPGGYERFVKVCKRECQKRVGIALEKVRGEVVICTVTLVEDALLEAGDTLLSVNGIAVPSATKAASMLATTKGTLYLTRARMGREAPRPNSLDAEASGNEYHYDPFLLQFLLD
jgi:hypothetical protein